MNDGYDAPKEILDDLRTASTTAPEPQARNRQRKIIGFLSIALTISVVALVGTTITVFRGAPYAPLDEYPVQRVNSALKGFDVPAALLSAGFVEITGTKCTNESTSVKGSRSWVEIEPGGGIINEVEQSEIVVAIRDFGCTTKTYQNEFPEKVLARVMFLGSIGVCESLWQLTGLETPIAPDGRDGLERTWKSQNFVIVNDTSQCTG